MKKLFLELFFFLFVSACAFGRSDSYVNDLSVEFLKPTVWGKEIIPAAQGCLKDGGRGATPALYISKIPKGTNLILLQINNEEAQPSVEGLHGTLGFYHTTGRTAVLPPVFGETFEIPKIAFMEKPSFLYPARPFPYYPPCIERNHSFVAVVRAVKRTGAFDTQKTELLGEGKIQLGRY